MMKNKKMLLGKIMTGVFIASSIATPAYAGWQPGTGEHEGKWRFENADGSYLNNGWNWLDGNLDGIEECYYFDGDGWMYSNTNTPDGYTVNPDGAWMENGVVKARNVQNQGNPGQAGPDQSGRWVMGDGVNAGRWWHENGDGSFKNNGWFWIDGNNDGIAECYYFDSEGWLIVNGTTPDGYTVNSDGAWVVGLVVQTMDLNHPSSSGTNESFYTRDDDEEWADYSDNSVSFSVNNFTKGNYDMMTSGEKSELQDAINDFKDTYITAGMSDFEKELMIIRWLVENCDYEIGENWSNSTAYSCIVNGKAQCSGYADAFLQTAKACGLDARYVYNATHAWNLVKLEGEWYHVDVTWEDPISGSGNGYGFEKLWGKYINLNDNEVKVIRSHKTWSPNSQKANGKKYNHFVVKNYLETGNLNHEARQAAQDAYQDMLDGYEASNSLIRFVSVDQASDEIIKYLSDAIDKKESHYNFLVTFDGYSDSDTSQSLKVYNYCDQIEENVNQKINAKYADILETELKVFVARQDWSKYEKLYCKSTGRLNFKPGEKAQVEYVINFIDNDTKERVGQQTGIAEVGSKIDYEFPDRYDWLTNRSHTINSGSVTNNGKSFTIKDKGSINMDVFVNMKYVPYKITYIDEETKEEVGIQEDVGKKNTNINYELPEGDWAVSEYTVNTGQVRADNTGFRIEGREEVDITVSIRKRSSTS